MKHVLFIAGIFMLSSARLYAQPQQKLNIEHATVFLSGAELTSTTKMSLSKGENEILFTNVAGDVNNQSITVNASGGVVVESVTFQNNYLATEVLSPKAKEIKDSIDAATESKQQTANKITVLTEQIAVLQSNRKVSGEHTGLSVAELTKMLDLISAKMEGYLNQKNKLDAQLKKIDERIVKLNKQLDEEQKKDYQPGGQLLVKFYAKEATASNITITYLVTTAGWTPTYDIMADDANSPIKLYYKANIFQNSGVKWNNVRLTLSTGNPNEGVNAPVINPWYLAFYVPNTYTVAAGGRGMYQNRAQNNFYEKSKVPMVAGVTADEAAETSINDYVTVDNSGVNTTFDIELPYTIPSDGQQHLVAIKKHELPATYRYYAVPKADKDAFLQAMITNWADLNLMPGTTNIFYEGTYVGQGTLDVRNTRDTMTISLGRDKKIVVKKERNTSRRSVKTIGTNVREEFAYTITVRNTRKEPINIIIQDQQPVSNDKDIVLEDIENGNAEYNATTGMLKWNFTIAPNETKKADFGFTVKYPKGKTISNLH